MSKLYLGFALMLFSLNVYAQGTPDLLDAKEKQIIISDDLNFDDEKVDAFGNEIKIKPQIITKKGSTEVAKVITSESSADDNLKLNTRKSLTDNLKENAEDTNNQSNATTWIGSGYNALKELAGKKSEEKSNPLSEMLEESKGQNRKSNVSVFDISGVMLRMSLKQAEDALSKIGYKKISQKMDIPNFIKWRNEETCRNNGIVGYERLNSCVIEIARKNNYEYVSEVEFNKFDTKESMMIFLTSNFTGNKIYKITYRTEAANMAGNSAKALYLRNIKVYDFWKKINQKYGEPDNKQDVIWGLGSNKPYMKAVTGALLLEDPMLKELDYTRMSREDQRFMNTDLYTF
ncbi:MAG: hypothetical protein E7016_02890 [Alphaproteobacteria bacterium]|nr:hypothetical protein [Alphaproteobacteria bacterium]